MTQSNLSSNTKHEQTSLLLQVTEGMVSAYFKPLKASEELHLEETIQHLQSRL